MSDNYLLVKGENGYMVKVRLSDLGDSTFAVAPAAKTGTILASAARTASVQGGDEKNYHAKGVIVVLDVTATNNAPSIVLKIQGKVAGKYYDILEGAAVTGISTNIYRVHPDLTDSPNLIAKDILPQDWRVTVTHDNDNSITYSIGYSTIL